VSTSETVPFERLAKMIERELELAGQGRLLELEAAVTERTAFLATLPSPAPAAALAVIERARALHSRLIIETLRAKESLAHSRASLRTARRLAKGYSQPARQRYSTTA
jgi:hypothetical protein